MDGSGAKTRHSAGLQVADFISRENSFLNLAKEKDYPVCPGRRSVRSLDMSVQSWNGMGQFFGFVNLVIQPAFLLLGMGHQKVKFGNFLDAGRRFNSARLALLICVSMVQTGAGAIMATNDLPASCTLIERINRLPDTFYFTGRRGAATPATTASASHIVYERRKTHRLLGPVGPSRKLSPAADETASFSANAAPTSNGDDLVLLPFLADKLANAPVVKSLSGSLLGVNLLASLEPGEPRHAGKPGGHSMWISWRAPASGIATFNTIGSLFDTLLAVYTGPDVATLTRVAANDDSGGLLYSRVQFNAVAGQEYHVAVDGFAFAVGTILLNWNLQPTLAQLPVLGLLTPGQTVGAGETVSLAVQVELQPLLSLQWLRNGMPIPGATNSILTIQNVQDNDVGNYALRARIGQFTVTTESSYLQINETDGGVNRDAAAFDKLGDAVDLLHPSGAAYKDLPTKGASSSLAKSGATSSGATARGFSGTQVFSTVGSTKDAGEPNHCGIVGGSSEWFAWQCPTNGTAVINTDGSSYDTVLAVYIGPGDSYSTLTNVACDNDSGTNGRTSRVTFAATSGTIYFIAVDGVNGASGTVRLNYAAGAAPVIAQQPASRTVKLGHPASLSVTVSALPSARYQWTFNGTNVANATNAVLSLASVSAAQLGAYRVRVTNAIGSAQSIDALLAPETPLQFSARRMTADGFHLSVSGPAGTNYVLEYSTNLTTWTGLNTNNTQTGLFDYVHGSRPQGNCFYRVLALP